MERRHADPGRRPASTPTSPGTTTAPPTSPSPVPARHPAGAGRPGHRRGARGARAVWAGSRPLRARGPAPLPPRRRGTSSSPRAAPTAATPSRSPADRSPRGPFEGCPGQPGPHRHAAPATRCRTSATPTSSTTPDGGDGDGAARRAPAGPGPGVLSDGPRDIPGRRHWTDGWPPVSDHRSHRRLPGVAGHRPVPGARPRVGGGPRHAGRGGDPDPDGLVLTGEGVGLEAMRPSFVGFRQRHPASFSATVNIAAGVGGVALRLDGDHFLAVEADGTASRRGRRSPASSARGPGP